jgi:predicted ATPase/DNA-binding SARP family transcriptional activator
MEFRILGSFEVVVTGGVVDLRGVKRLGLLACLVVHAGQPVSKDRLVEELWGEGGSEGAARTVQTYVSQVRKLLHGERASLQTRPGGYVLDVDPMAVDAYRFEKGVTAARAGPDRARRLEVLDGALALWRGPPLGEFAGAGWADREVARLEALRLQALQCRCDILLELDHVGEAVAELEGLVRAHPLDESLWTKFMLALYRSGRQADALGAYQRARRHLVGELGIEPGPELADLEHRILDHDPTLDAPSELRVTVAEPAAPTSGATDGRSPPGGTVTFLFTGLEQSSSLWEADPDVMDMAVNRHDALVRSIIGRWRGTVFATAGDGFGVAFASDRDAIRAAIEAQEAVRSEPWPKGFELRVRMGLHTGASFERDGNYFGPPVNRAARIMGAAHGGQVLVSQVTRQLVDEQRLGLRFVDLGRHRLRGLDTPEQLCQLVIDGDDTTYPPPAALSAASFQFGEFQLDDRQLTLSGPAGPVPVEHEVFELLRYLILNHDRVVSKEELLDAIWGDRFVAESMLTSRVQAARQAVGDDGQAQRVIKTVHRRGYQFIAEVRIDAGRIRRTIPRLRNAPIGRDGDIASVVERIRDAPLVTITGSGGIGKTTVALAVADRAQTEHADGAVFVDLAPVPPQSDLTRAVAEAAGVEGAASETVERVADHLANRPVLLVLDNCEHVLERAADFVDRMLERGEAARILATSREPLGVTGEHVWPLGPLHDEGPALFVERARASEPRVHWDPADPAVIELCRRLDDVPLALELAAGQLRRFDLDELNRRLEDRLDLLSGRASGDAQRHATMETAIDWSYQLLDGAEQCLLRHLSVFPSWFDVRAVEASAPPLSGTVPVRMFGQLVDKSLVVRLPGSGRYRLLETIRVFARHRLDQSGEAASAFERHRRHVRERIGSASRLDRWLSAGLGGEFRTDLEDARQAFRLSLEHDDVDDAVEIAIGASFLWRNSIGCAEGNTWIEDLLDLELTPHDELWAHILRADLGQGRGDHHQMFDSAAAAEGLVDRTDDPSGACLAAHYSAMAHLTNLDQAKGRLAAALELAHRSGDVRLVTLIEAYFAIADLAAGRHDQARATVTRLDRAASDDGYDRFILHWAGWLLALAEQDATLARRWMSLQQDFLNRTGIVESWITWFSTAMCDALDGSEVSTTLARTLALADREGYHANADCVLVLAYTEVCARRFKAAAELIGTASHSRFNATANYVLYRAVLDRMLREHLDAGSITEAMARGRGRTAAEALAEYGITDPFESARRQTRWP